MVAKLKDVTVVIGGARDGVVTIGFEIKYLFKCYEAELFSVITFLWPNVFLQ